MYDAYRTLEFTTILEELKEYALSAGGSRKLSEVQLMEDETAILEEMDRVSYLQQIMQIRELSPSCVFPEIEEVLEKAEKSGYVLDEKNLYAAAQFLHSAQLLFRYITHPPDELDIAAADFTYANYDFQSLIKEIFAAILPPGEMNLKHPRLKPLISALEKLKTGRQSASSAIMKKQNDLWQQKSPTIIDGRVVLPLKAQNKNKIDGLIQGASSSGQTVYIEPAELVAYNNEITVQNERLRQEIFTVLKELSQKIRNRLEEIAAVYESVSVIDAVYAKARFACIHDCSRPQIGGGNVQLAEARHPLLGRNAVPVSILIPEGKRVVIMTGPNAGGKTVTVKTLGLFSLMVKFGMLIPASPESRLPVFSSIHADIGDDQSIEESLSTFSGHMKKIGDILSRSSEASLIILDELGSGTDPLEGGALAQSILEYILDIGCIAMVTSHHTSLKKFAYSHDLAVNASMEYNTRMHRPTYQVVFGRAGKSYAIETAQRVGLPEEIIRRAEENKKANDDEVLSIINNLEEKEIASREKENQLNEWESSLRSRTDSVRTKEYELSEMLQRIKQQQHDELISYIQKKEQEINALKKSVKETLRNFENLRQENTGTAAERSSLEHAASELESSIDDVKKRKKTVREELQKQKDIAAEYKSYHFVPGMPVYAGKIKQKGVIKQKSQKKGFWIVEIGSLRIEVHQHDLEPRETPVTHAAGGRKNVQTRKVSFDLDIAHTAAVYEIDVRGMTLQEALDRVEKQLDAALLSSMNSFSIIHGMGSGILQKGIHEYLRDAHPVKSFGFASPEDGGFGKTYVTLYE